MNNKENLIYCLNHLSQSLLTSFITTVTSLGLSSVVTPVHGGRRHRRGDETAGLLHTRRGAQRRHRIGLAKEVSPSASPHSWP
jgi:hypothetical protein